MSVTAYFLDPSLVNELSLKSNCFIVHNSICMTFKASVINVSFKCGYLSFSHIICFCFEQAQRVMDN